jgi:hypothetical protein
MKKHDMHYLIPFPIGFGLMLLGGFTAFRDFSGAIFGGCVIISMGLLISTLAVYDFLTYLKK